MLFISFLGVDFDIGYLTGFVPLSFLGWTLGLSPETIWYASTKI
jgi:hypothetical protein